MSILFRRHSNASFSYVMWMFLCLRTANSRLICVIQSGGNGFILFELNFAVSFSYLLLLLKPRWLRSTSLNQALALQKLLYDCISTVLDQSNLQIEYLRDFWSASYIRLVGRSLLGTCENSIIAILNRKITQRVLLIHSDVLSSYWNRISNSCQHGLSHLKRTQ